MNANALMSWLLKHVRSRQGTLLITPFERGMHTMKSPLQLDLPEESARLHDASPRRIVEWALSIAGEGAIVSTNFRPLAAVTLHAVSQVAPGIPVIWVDTGHNTPSTYRFAERLIERLRLNMHVYTPRLTTARWEALNGPVPGIFDEEPHRRFTRDVKLEPFERALRELNPIVWFSGIRKVQSEHRGALDIATRDDRGIIKVSPVFHFTDADMERYLVEHDLPDEKDYFDPTTVLENRECGLHLPSEGEGL